MGKQHQLGNRPVIIKLADERGEDFRNFHRFVGPGEIGPRAPVLPRAEKENLDANLSPLLSHAKNISLIKGLRVYALGLGDETHGLYAVTQPRRLLKI